MSKKCTRCSVVQQLTQFHKYSDTNRYSRTCNNCRKTSFIKKREIIEKNNTILNGLNWRMCISCGYLDMNDRFSPNSHTCQKCRT